MATGDNVLTAISVARQCNIIESDKDVWLGDIQTVNDQQVVIWKSTSFEVNEKTKNEPTDQFPWNYLDRNVEVAVTGKAFRHIIENK
jgi:magnesium-transporting ATPase (P-type)